MPGYTLRLQIARFYESCDFCDDCDFKDLLFFDGIPPSIIDLPSSASP